MKAKYQEVWKSYSQICGVSVFGIFAFIALLSVPNILGFIISLIGGPTLFIIICLQITQLLIQIRKPKNEILHDK